MKLARLARPLSRVVMVAAMCVFGSAAVAAQGTVTGRVTAEGTNEPIGGAQVILVATNEATTTAADGRYTLTNVRPGEVAIQVLRVSYQSLKKTVTVTAGGTATLDFSLVASVIKLQDVVTTATGQQRKVELGNSLSTLGDVNQKVEQSSINDLGDLLVAKAPGVIVLPGNMTGSSPVIRIRGLSSLSLTNAPIFIIDGIRMNSGVASNQVGGTTTNFLNNIDPDEIEDVEIVKGPSAATLYGTDASNGVIVITTKKGRAGNTRWTWSAEDGAVDDKNQYPGTYATWGHNPTTGQLTRCELVTEASGACVADSLTYLNLLTNSSLSAVHAGSRNQEGMQANGGSEQVRFFVSGDIQNETGPVQMPQFSVNFLDSLASVNQGLPVNGAWLHPEFLQQENMRANLSASFSPSFDMTVNSGFSKSDQRLPQVDNNTFSFLYSALNAPGFAHPVTGSVGMNYSDLSLPGEVAHGYGAFLPAEIFQDVQSQDIQRFIGSTTSSWRPFSWMQNDGTVGMDLADQNVLGTCLLNECPNSGTTRQGSVSNTIANTRLFSAKIISTSTWQAKTWMNIKTTLGGDYLNNENDGSRSSGTVLPPGADQVGQAANLSASNTIPQAVKTLGVYIQEQASLRDKLFLTAGVRSDQNSAFGTQFQRVYYPKASLSWALSDESFFPHYSWLDQFRLRTAYGASGVQPGSTTALQQLNAATVNIATTGGSAGTDTPGLRISALGNTTLKPETSAEFEGGFDANMIHNRIHLELTYYSRQTSNALIALPIAPSVGSPATSITTNIASVKNAGVEATMTTQLADTRRLGWDLTVSASHNSNKVVSLGTNPGTGLPYPTIGTGQTRDSIGLPINGAFFLPYTYSDANKNGIIEPSEVAVGSTFQYFGYTEPRDLVSVQNGFDLLSRKLRINVLLDYKGGYDLFNNSSEFYCDTTNVCAAENLKSTSLWDQARLIAQRYEAVTTEQGYNENGQFWRLREVSANWTLPATVSQRLLRSKDASLTFAARNLHVWTKYTGTDPEANYATGDVQTDFSTVSPPTYFVLKLNLHY